MCYNRKRGDSVTIGERIKKLRLERGLTQKQVADSCGMADSAIRKYESGKVTPKYEMLQRIAAALSVEWTELVPVDEQGAAIAAHVIEKAGLTVKDKDGNVIHQGDGRKWRKMTDAEQYRAGFLQFYSEDDRIAYFYRLLNEDGKLAAGVCFFRHLDKATWGEVANYVMGLSENPLYQRPAAPQDTPAPQEGNDTTPAPDAPGTPPEGE